MKSVFALLLSLALTAGAPLAGKVVIVTGSTSGIGKETAVHLATLGAKVMISGRSVDAGEEVVKSITSRGLIAAFSKMDVTKEADVEAAFTKAERLWGGVDFVFANAGYEGAWAPWEDWDAADGLKVLNINVIGPALALKYSKKHMKKGGAVVITSSMAGSFANGLFASMPSTTLAIYSASKAAVDVLVSAATSLAKDETAPIRVYGLAPAFYVTEMSRNAVKMVGMEKVEHGAAFNPIFNKVPGDASWLGPMVASMFTGEIPIPPGSSVMCDNKYMFPLHELKKNSQIPGAFSDIDLSTALDQNGKPSPLTQAMVDEINAEYVAASKAEL